MEKVPNELAGPNGPSTTSMPPDAAFGRNCALCWSRFEKIEKTFARVIVKIGTDAYVTKLLAKDRFVVERTGTLFYEIATMRATGSFRESAPKYGPIRRPPSPDRQRPLHPKTAACKQPTVMCVAPIRMKLWLHAHTSHLSVNSRPKPLEMETTVEYNFRDY
jgi:hypothetical protein